MSYMYITDCNIGTSNSVTMRYEQTRKAKQAQETTKKAQRRERETAIEANYHAQARRTYHLRALRSRKRHKKNELTTTTHAQCRQSAKE